MPYTYLWIDLSIPDTIPGETDSSITGLCAGDYVVVVTDDSGSVDSATVTITEPPIFTSSITGQTNVSCANGACDGTATVTPLGGTPPYTYLWLDDALVPLNPAQTDSTATNLCALQYFVQIDDTNGCLSVSSVIITEPAVLSIGVDSMTPSQCVVCDGTASVSATGGTPPYSYLWNDTYAQTNPLADSLCISTYTVTATDSNGCVTTLNVVVTGPGGFFSFIDTTNNTTCAGSCDGQAAVLGSGGNPPYTYAWINLSIPDTITGATDSILAGLCAGNYYAAVTDNDTCTSTTAAFTIFDPPPFLANITDSNGVTCYGDSDGTATVTITNGIPPYDYVWSSGDSSMGTTDTSNIDSGLFAGAYFVTVTDSNGCIAIDSINIPTPLLLTATITDSIDVSCGGMCTGSATVTPSGGTLPYSYLWSNSDTDSIADSLCAGNYLVTVTDINGCAAVTAVTITEPAAMISFIGIGNISCFGGCDGSFSVTVTGGVPPYIYLWSNGDSASFTDSLCDGNYSVMVTDSNNCITQDSLLITEPVLLTVSITDSSAVCEPLCNGNALATPSGGTLPYSYLWDAGTTPNDSATGGLCSGMHQLTVTDANSCMAIDSVIVFGDTLPPVADAGLDAEICPGESVTLGASGIPPAGGYTWSPLTGLSCTNCQNPEATPSSTNTYTVTVKNIACTDSDQVTVAVNLCLLGPIPEVITPNGDGTNDIFEIPNIEYYPENTINVFNQWGSIVFSTNQYHNINNYWEGKTNEGKRLPDATYFYILKLKDDSEPLSGFVMIHK